MITKPSGEGVRSTMYDGNGEPYVSIWAWTEDDSEIMAYQGDLRRHERMEEERVRMEREFARQMAEEYRRIRARA